MNIKSFLLATTLILTPFVNAATEYPEDLVKKVDELERKYHLQKSQSSVNSVVRDEELLLKTHQYKVFQLEHRKDTFRFQSIQTVCIFVVVMILVLGGFYMAFMQFKLDEKKSIIGRNINSDENSISDQLEKNKTTTFEVSKDGIKISSSVIGLIVLAMSFAFFYLYISNVYEIKEVGAISFSESSTSQ